MVMRREAAPMKHNRDPRHQSVHTKETNLTSLIGMAEGGGPSTALVLSAPSMPVGPSSARRYKRARADELLIKVRIGDGMLVARVEDISVGGLFARTQKQIPVGAFVEMGLLRPGAEELPLRGTVIADTAQRAGLAVKFEGIGRDVIADLRRIVDEAAARRAAAEEGGEPEVSKQMRLPPHEPTTGRDLELEEVRRRLAVLAGENDRLRGELAAAEQAQRLVGRLQIELERLKARDTAPRTAGSAVNAVDPELLATLKRDAEAAWTAIARLADSVDRIK